jgi:hypothetical protein
MYDVELERPGVSPWPLSMTARKAQ